MDKDDLILNFGDFVENERRLENTSFKSITCCFKEPSVRSGFWGRNRTDNFSKTLFFLRIFPVGRRAHCTYTSNVKIMNIFTADKLVHNIKFGQLPMNIGLMKLYKKLFSDIVKLLSSQINIYRSQVEKFHIICEATMFYHYLHKYTIIESWKFVILINNILELETKYLTDNSFF